MLLLRDHKSVSLCSTQLSMKFVQLINLKLEKELNKLLCIRSNPIIVFLYVLYM